ncbi:hypothetical protein KNU56_gp09 [Gordonia phage Arri]|uniref:Uncharacterized protein n=1 Tax=Gordonia phage Arri TaxID=2588127 RepID=A0A4Y5TZC4_9CAUD|nr:hypothetical protein KNU56_gp09 [Gordonia phage Arri]QDB74786.1 hypothetical protein SEA_ARRI_9 [Gordonia phage Arri]
MTETPRVIICQMTGGSGCPDDEQGRHYFAYIDPNQDCRICIDCGAPETEGDRT